MSSYGYLDTVSVLCDTAQLLADHGYDVDILTEVWPGFQPPRFESPHVKVDHLPRAPQHRFNGSSASRQASFGRRRLRTLLERSNLLPILRRGRSVVTWIRQTLAGIVVDVQMLKRAVSSRWFDHQAPYGHLIGVDPDGLVRAASLARFTQTRLVYYSLELMLSAELRSRADRALKARERKLSQRAEFVVIQDEERAQLLSVDNSVPLERFVLAPNAPLGPARRAPSRWWHERFDLPPDCRVLLHAGSIGPWTGIEGIVDAAAQLPEGWVLVVHTRYEPTLARHDAKAARELESLRERAVAGRVYFSLNPVPRQEFGRLVDGADAGIAFYVPTPGGIYTQQNIEVIGLSSGKVSTYLWAGLPVVVNAASTLGTLSEREGFGVCVEEASELSSAVRRIEEGYGRYSTRALEFFDENLDFRVSFKRIMARLGG